MTKDIIAYIVAFVVMGAFLLAWNAVDVGTQKKTVHEGHFMVKGYALGFVFCALIHFLT